MDANEYLIEHLGFGKFQVKMSDGQTKEADDNLVGIVRYTYFFDYTLPEIGWQVTKSQLSKDYHPKMLGDLVTGRLFINPFSSI